MIIKINTLYETLFYKYADKRTLNWPMCGSPFVSFSIMAVYILFVTKFGKLFMKNRPAYHLTKVIQVYNIVQIVMNASMFFLNMYVFFGIRDWSCFGSHTFSKGSRLESLGLLSQWLYTINKYMDLLDTVFFVLRKNFHLITTLHVYHHILMASVPFWIGRYYPLGEASMVPFVNSLVHAFMYYYYYIKISNKSKVDNVWWKKYITQLQLAQFSFLLAWFSWRLYSLDCTNIYPKQFSLLILVQAMVMLYMFGSYYHKAFLTPKKVSDH